MISIKNLKLDSRLNIKGLEFEAHSINVILGPNGGGKSSLLEIISKNIENYSGNVKLENVEIMDIEVSRHAQQISYIPQRLDWNLGLKVREIILFSLYPFRRNIEMTDEDRDRFNYLISSLELSEFLDRSFGHLSGGEQKRVAIASALFQNTKLIIMDEPFAALDPYYKQMVADTLNRWNRDYQVTMILSVHDLYIAKYIGHHFWGLKDGEITGQRRSLDKDFFESLYNTNFNSFKFRENEVFLPTFEEKGDE